jgi:hypothetical protein
VGRARGGLKELAVLPSRWKASLAHWHGIYYIFDTSDGKGDIGSAYGQENIAQRWLEYAASGHGGNALLRKRDPQDFQFSILQRVSPRHGGGGGHRGRGDLEGAPQFVCEEDAERQPQS